MNLDFSSVFNEGGIHSMVQMFRELDDNGDSSDDDMSTQTQLKNDKAGEDPLFKAVIINRRGKMNESASSTGTTSGKNKTTQTNPLYDDPEAAEKEKYAKYVEDRNVSCPLTLNQTRTMLFHLFLS